MILSWLCPLVQIINKTRGLSDSSKVFFFFFLARQLYRNDIQLVCFSKALPAVKIFFSAFSKVTAPCSSDAPCHSGICPFCGCPQGTWPLENMADTYSSRGSPLPTLRFTMLGPCPGCHIFGVSSFKLCE